LNKIQVTPEIARAITLEEGWSVKTDRVTGEWRWGNIVRTVWLRDSDKKFYSCERRVTTGDDYTDYMVEDPSSHYLVEVHKVEKITWEWEPVTS
jgi:hypothetical protein